MALMDRDYMRRRQDGDGDVSRDEMFGNGPRRSADDTPLEFTGVQRSFGWSRVRWQGKLAMIASILAIGSAARWFYRDARALFPSAAPAEGSLLVNINEATLKELESLPDIGPARAQLIIQHRPYQSADDLKNIRGIPDGVIDDLKPLLRVSGATERTGR